MRSLKISADNNTPSEALGFLPSDLHPSDLFFSFVSNVVNVCYIIAEWLCVLTQSFNGVDRCGGVILMLAGEQEEI